jgi:hypothetical protein
MTMNKMFGVFADESSSSEPQAPSSASAPARVAQANHRLRTAAAGLVRNTDIEVLLFTAAAFRSLQLAVGYDPQPPFDSGSPAKLPPHVLEFHSVRFAAARAAAVPSQ